MAAARPTTKTAEHSELKKTKGKHTHTIGDLILYGYVYMYTNYTISPLESGTLAV